MTDKLCLYRTLSRERPELVKFTTSAEDAGLPWLKPFQVATERLVKGAQNSFCLNWQNPESVPIMVHMVVIYISVAGVATSIIDLGPATAADTHSDTLIDGAALDGAPPVYLNSFDNAGTNGVAIAYLDAKDGTTDWITGQILTAAGTNLAGYVYIAYTTMDYNS